MFQNILGFAAIKSDFLNHSSAMLDKLKLAAILATLFLAEIFSCSLSSQKEYKVNTEIICPNGSALLVKFINAKDLGDAIQIAYRNKKRLKTSENYTTVKVRDGRSFVLKNFPPEVAANCALRESLVGQAEPGYVHHF